LAEIAVSGSTPAYWAANLAATLEVYKGTPNYVLIDLGINSLPAAEVQFKLDFANILDQFHAKWPTARVGVAHVWGRDISTADVNTWIDAVLADGRTAWTYAGPDETVWLEGGDNGATMTTDGIHYSAAGQTENAAQWKAAMGY
jgi:lysophospholipase L1-like esterase